MHIFITGIAGFIGQQTAKRALAKGWQVSGMEASAVAAQRTEKELGIPVFVGDISSQDDCNAALKTADIVLNTAAIVQEDGDWNQFRAVNVQGAMNIARSAIRVGVKQYIQLSSVMVYGFHYVPFITEEGLVSGDDNPYCQTKIEAEIALRRLHHNDFAVTILRPGDVYGPGSIPWVIRPLEMMKSWQFLYIDGGKGYFNYVYVDNLIDAIFLATDPKAYGQTFNITDGAVTNKVYFSQLAAMAGITWLPSLPGSVIKPASSLLSGIFERLGKPLRINAQAIRYMQRPHPYSNEKAKIRLGYQPVISLEKGLELTKNWLRSDRPELLT
jgi:nucleoside-diphosphate-sugar epimerase